MKNWNKSFSKSKGEKYTRKRFAKAFALLVGLILIMAIPVAMAWSGMPEHGENIYGGDSLGIPFPKEYANGYIQISNTIPSDPDLIPNTYSWTSGSTKVKNLYGAGNTEKDTTIYLDHIGGAYMDRKLYDIREYVWKWQAKSGASSWKWKISEDGTMYITQTSTRRAKIYY